MLGRRSGQQPSKFYLATCFFVKLNIFGFHDCHNISNIQNQKACSVFAQVVRLLIRISEMSLSFLG
jgi:hypothetical protein